MELDLATARGGRHRLLRRGWVAYAMWIFAPLGLALVIAAITSLPGTDTGAPIAGGPASKLPAPPVPTPAGGVSPPSGGLGVPVSLTSPPTNPPHQPSPHTTPAAPTVFGRPAVTPATGSPSPTPTSSSDSITLEAEAGVLGSQLATARVPGASGGMVVTGLGKNSHRTLTLPDITVAVSGYYLIDLGYTATDPIGIDLHTSGGSDASMSCPATPADTMSWCATMVLLDAGTNSISVEGQQNNEDAALDLVILS